jgi:UDP-GlcNAc:undecaprenyl-phosphate/decaprenyl-phosphate GlcNAc-1-phosphate transferase
MIHYGLLIIIFILPLSVSLFLTPLMRRLSLGLGVLAHPDKRKIHREPVPCLGGVAIYLSFMIGMIILLVASASASIELLRQIIGIFVAGTVIVSLGLWDDIADIKPWVKLTGQLVACGILFYFGLRIELLRQLFFGKEMHLSVWLSMPLTFLWFLGLMNAMNLIDGLDGLAAGIAVIVSFVLIGINLYLGNYVNVYILMSLAAACLGFLRFNFYPAKIFMGDSGSMFLGLILASVALMGSQHKAAAAAVLLTPLTALAIPVYDTFAAIMRRVSQKQPIFKADKKHLHHRLLDLGLTQKQIVIFLYLATLYLSAFGFLFILIPKGYAFMLLSLIALGGGMAIIIVGFIEDKLRAAIAFRRHRRRALRKN